MASEHTFNWVPKPLKPYVNQDTISGILLILSAIIAFIIANSPGAGYHAFTKRELGIHFNEWN